jgi:hypothetical protein
VSGEVKLYRSAKAPARMATLRIALAAGVVAVLWGGYHSHWSWTGINGQTATLWDWINLLLVPITVGTLPIWLSKRRRLRRTGTAAAATVLILFAALVVAGYTVPWGWTGFEGNALWDWINLLLLPLVIATFPVWAEIRRELRIHHRVLLIALLAGFVLAAVGGYVWDWGWTGFRGNTLWDWLHLLLLPIAIPAILLPAAVAITSSALTQREGEAGG